MRVKAKSYKKSLKEKPIVKPSKEYTTEELIELGKQRNILKLARPLYDNGEQKNEEKETD